MDFEGLLDGLETEEAREARKHLVRELLDAGVSEEELREAAAEERLAALPLELVYTRDCRFTLREMMDELGIGEDFVRSNFLAVGLPQPDLDEVALSDKDMEAWRMIKLMFDSGVDEETVLKLGRTAGRTAAQTAETLLETFTRLYARPGDSEADFGLRMAEVATTLGPALGPMVETPVRWHLRQLTRQRAAVQLEAATGGLPDTRDVAVCFADLVDYTSLTERSGVPELGEVTTRLEEIAADCAEPPVRLVKLIGDAAMFVCPEVEPLVDVAAALVDRAEADERLPQLRAGIAAGEGLNRGGDWYGRPVNLAARIAARADPGTLFADASVTEATRERHGWDERGDYELKGIDEPVALYCLRP
jgi:adenylate cyclase